MPPDEGPLELTTAADVVDGESASDRSAIGKRRLLYGLTTGLLAVILGLAVLDGVGALDVYGPDTSTVDAEGGGYRLEVTYPAVSRPGLASPFEVIVEPEAGFTEAVTIGIDRAYLRIWDENGRHPTPSTESSQGDWVVWEFDPPDAPDARALSFTMDARIEAGVQARRRGRVAVLEDGRPVVTVEFSTAVRP